MKILLVEDDEETIAYVRLGLEQEGHGVDTAMTLEQGQDLLRDYRYDLLIIDRKLHGQDGITLVKKLRASQSNISILFLTALGGLNDRVEGLEAGGDDYLQKPFAFSELRARINAIGRRHQGASPQSLLNCKDLSVDLAHRSVTRAGASIDLLTKEFQLLVYLLRHQGRVVTRTMLLEQVWDIDFDPGTNVVESHISKLRSKIDKPFSSQLLRTVRGAGYVLGAP